MITNNEMLKRIAKLGMLLMIVASMSACTSTMTWKEEVKLHDGSKIIVKRSVARGGRHEIGQRPPIKEQSLSVVLPSNNQRITWEDHFSEDVGSSSFNPMLLEVFGDTAYVLSSPAGCLSYNKWGRPNPPYVVFKYQGKEWKRIPLQELPTEIKLPNLIISSPDDVAKNAKDDVISSEMIRRENEGFAQPEYKTILREALPNAGGSCIKADYYKGAGWLSPDWFTDQPSLDACLKLCNQKNIATETCPCNSVFKGEKK